MEVVPSIEPVWLARSMRGPDDSYSGFGRDQRFI